MRRLIAVLMFLIFSNATWADQKSGNPEFDGYCAYSLANGGEMKTECDVVWIAGDGKLYCFANEGAKKEFLKDAERNLRKAKAFWDDPAYWEKIKKEEQS